MKFFKRHSRGSLALVLILTSTIGIHHHAQASPSWPNEPASSRPIIDCDFSTPTCGGQLIDNFGGGHTTTDATAPLSPSSVLQNVNSPTCHQGCAGVLWRHLNNLNEVYIGFWWHMNSDFEGAGVYTNKLFFVKTDDMNSFMGAYGPPGSASFQMRFNSQNNAGIITCHMAGTQQPCTSTQGGWIFPIFNTGQAYLVKNTWNRIEMYGKRSTSRTSRDGVLKYWLNGVLIGSWTDMNWGNGGFTTFMITHTWDGSWAVIDPDHTWIHTIDHVRVSQPNAGSTSDTTAPSVPAGLRAQAFSSSQINLTWNASTDNVGVTGYRIFRAGAQIGTATGATFSNTGLSASTTYSYTVAAYDAAGNASGQSAAASTTTHAAATGAVGTASNLSASAAGANSVTLSFTEVTDGAGQPAKYDVRFSSSGTLWGGARSVTQGTCSTPLAGTTVGAVKTCTVLGLSPSTAYQFQLIAFRGTIGAGAVYGALSNLAGATTSSAANVMPPAKPKNLRAR